MRTAANNLDRRVSKLRPSLVHLRYLVCGENLLRDAPDVALGLGVCLLSGPE